MNIIENIALRTALVCLAASFPMRGFCAPMCPLEELADKAANSPLCHFYQGTTAYRNEDFELAAKHWKDLIALKSVAADERHLQIDAYNNLGFLYFQGWGVKANKSAAIDYWAYASNSGNEESAYHLCHAYADRKQPTYSQVLGRAHCAEALRRYESLKKTTAGHETIVKQIKSHIQTLNR
jgi:TPR repeat protein